MGFSPNGDALDIVLYGIEGAQASIDIAASKPIAVALIAAKNRGVKVRVVADMKANQDKYTAVNFLANRLIKIIADEIYIKIFKPLFIMLPLKQVDKKKLNLAAI